MLELIDEILKKLQEVSDKLDSNGKSFPNTHKINGLLKEPLISLNEIIEQLPNNELKNKLTTRAQPLRRLVGLEHGYTSLFPTTDDFRVPLASLSATLKITKSELGRIESIKKEVPKWNNENRGIWYDLMQVCEKGHMITAFGEKTPEKLVKHCPTCGSKTLTKCPKCNSKIKGYPHNSKIGIAHEITPKDYCDTCGSAYPWKEENHKKIQNDNDANTKLLNIFECFHRFCLKLKNRKGKKEPLIINDEYDVQYLLYALLSIDFEDVRLEEWTPSYTGSSSKMDFLIKNDEIVIETKMTRENLSEKELGDELNIDINKYKKHPNCKKLFCFIYDPEYKVKNPTGLRRDLEELSDDKMRVSVYISPKI